MLVRGNEAHAVDEYDIQRLAQFYRLDLRVVDISCLADIAPASSLIHSSSTVAVLVSADVLPEFYTIRQSLRNTVLKLFESYALANAQLSGVHCPLVSRFSAS